MRRIPVILMALVLVGFMCVPASAFIKANWQTSQQMYLNGTTTLVEDGSLVQLIWSPDAVISDIRMTGSSTPVGGEYVLDTLDYGDFRTSDGTIYPGASSGYFTVQDTQYENDALSGSGISDVDFLAGSLYLRVFDSTSPGINSWYYEGALSSPLFENPSNPDDFNSLNLAPGTSPYELNQQLVPEPGTFALFGVGLVTMLARRRRTRK